MEERRCIESVT